MAYILAFLMLFMEYAIADVWVVSAPDKSVYSMSEAPDAVIPAGYTVEVLKGSINDLALSRPIDEYTFTGKKFKVDAGKVKVKEDKQLVEEQKKANRAAKKQSAIDKLKALGLDEFEIDAITGKE